MEVCPAASPNEPGPRWLATKPERAHRILFRVSALFLSGVAARNQGSSIVFSKESAWFWGEPFSCDVVPAFSRIQAFELSGNWRFSGPNTQPGFTLRAAV